MALEPQRTDMPNDARNDTSGRFAPKYPNESFTGALDELGEVGTREVAEHVGCDFDTARLRLQNLAEQGAVEKRQVSSVTLWSLAEVPA